MLQEQIYDEEDYSHRKKKRLNHSVAASLLHSLTINRSPSGELPQFNHTVTGVEGYGTLEYEDLEASSSGWDPIPLVTTKSTSSEKYSSKSEKIHNRKRWIKTAVGSRVHDDDVRLISPLVREPSNTSGSSIHSADSNNSKYNRGKLTTRSGLFRSFTDGHDINSSVEMDENVDTESTDSSDEFSIDGDQTSDP